MLTHPLVCSQHTCLKTSVVTVVDDTASSRNGNGKAADIKMNHKAADIKMNHKAADIKMNHKAADIQMNHKAADIQRNHLTNG